MDLIKELERLDNIGTGKTILEPVEMKPQGINLIEALDPFNLEILNMASEYHKALAIKIIEKALDKYPRSRPYVAYSGGKSSGILVDLLRFIAAKRNIEFTIMFSNTTIEYPDNIHFVRDSVKEIDNAEYIELHPEKSFFTFLRAGQPFPDKNNRWCCTPLKSEPSRAWFEKNDPDPLLFLGSHRTENSYRYHYEPFDHDNSKNPNAHVFHPLLHWDDREVWHYIQSVNLDYNPLYNKAINYKDQWRHWHTLIFVRNGCYLCPLGHIRNYPQFLILKAHYPTLFRILKRCVLGSKNKVLLTGRTRGRACGE